MKYVVSRTDFGPLDMENFIPELTFALASEDHDCTVYVNYNNEQAIVSWSGPYMPEEFKKKKISTGYSIVESP